MKAIDLLKVNFNKYERVQINFVTIRGLSIVAEKGYSGTISILGSIDDNLIFTAHYNENDEMRIKVLDKKCLVIRKEERRDETN